MVASVSPLDVLTVGEVSRIVEVSPQTIRQWARIGRLRPVRLTSSGWRLYRRGDVERIVAERVGILKEKRDRASGVHA